MALPRTTKNTACHEHDLAIQKLEGRMETIERHHKYYRENIDELFTFVQDVKISLVKIENAIDKNKDLPERMRKQEDKSIFLEIVEKIAWIAVGALVAGYISQTYIAPKAKDNQEKTASI
jgi:GTP1/Obg family GTP-binding protein